MIIENKEFEIREEYNVNKYNNTLQIRLKGINNITDISYKLYVLWM